jgi:hypothetical protein
MKTKIITCIYSHLNGTELGGRKSRYNHYRWSLLSLLNMTDADFLCYTNEDEIEDLKNFFYIENNISENKLQFKIYDLHNTPFKKLLNKYKDFEAAKNSDRCIEIQYMKFFWFLEEDLSYDNYYWFDAGLSHCGLIPPKYRDLRGTYNNQYYSTKIFNNIFLRNLNLVAQDKFIFISKENSRNYWSGSVKPEHFEQYDNTRYIIGGFFGGPKKLWTKIVTLFTKYVYEVTYNDNFLYHEELIMTLMFRNHPELFKTFEFDIWWHENERVSGVDMEELVKHNKSFYKILEELNDLI